MTLKLQPREYIDEFRVRHQEDRRESLNVTRRIVKSCLSKLVNRHDLCHETVDPEPELD